MKKQVLIAAGFLAATFIQTSAWAEKPEFTPLDAPVLDGCDVSADPATLDWSDVEGAAKYSVDFTCSYTDPVLESTTTHEFNIGTGDREDGGLMGDSDLSVSYQQMDDAAGENLSGFSCTAKVKGLNPPGNNSNRQKHLFSEEVDCGTLGEHDWL